MYLRLDDLELPGDNMIGLSKLALLQTIASHFRYRIFD